MSQQLLDDLLKPNGVRFCHDVPHKECEKCKLGCSGHPLVRSLDSTPECEESLKLCIKDCLKMKIPMVHNKEENSYELKT